MKYKKGYFNLEQSLITGGLVMIALFIFFKIFNPIPSIEAEPEQLTGFEIGQYISNLEKDNRENAITLAKQYEDLVYWSNIDQAEEIKRLQKRPNPIFTWVWYGLWIFFMIVSIIMFGKNTNKQDKINELELKLTNVKVELYSKNKKKVTIMKEIFEEKDE